MGGAERQITYSEAGVDRDMRDASKRSLAKLESTHQFSHYGPLLRLPFGNLIPMNRERTRYQDHKIEGIGTKVLLAQLADKYDTIGIDGVAMVVNDVIRSGAGPISIVDNIDAEKSEPDLVDKWMTGIVAGAQAARAPIVDGEIADVAILLRGLREGKGHHIVCGCVGEVDVDEIISGKGLVPGDVVIGLQSSGVHSNGISLVRKVLFAEWGGFYKDPFASVDGLDIDLVSEVLKPTIIYSEPVLITHLTCGLKAAVHVTGDAHKKFEKLFQLNPGIGFEFDDLRPQPIFEVLQQTARQLCRKISDEEMLKTFNMGDGFDVVVDAGEEETVIREFQKRGINAWRVGKVTNSGHVVAKYNGQTIQL
ncbi:MAG: AIR synthase-related protein [Candidatus Micrarchaeales archaeon]